MSNSEGLLEPKAKRKRSLPGNPDPDAEVIALSPKSLMTTNRFVCEICNKGFQRDQNLQLHRRGHNLPWKLKQRSDKDTIKKKVYVCPELSCVHHSPSRALGDLTGIKKHYCRKHGEKKWRCDKCSKKYAVHSDWKAHVKTCGTREYRCDCGILFARKDSFITHRAFCDALAEESARLIASSTSNSTTPPLFLPFSTSSIWDPLISSPNPNPDLNPNPNPNPSSLFDVNVEHEDPLIRPPFTTAPSPHLSATALLQKASMMGPTTARHVEGIADPVPTWQGGKKLTRDFLGVSAGEEEELMTLDGLEMDMVSVDRVNGFGLPGEEECPCFL